MSGSRSRPGRKPSQDKYLFGTPDEISNRTNTLYTEFVPDDTHPNFTQIAPQSGSAQSVNRAPIDKKEGSIKFAGGPGVP